MVGKKTHAFLFFLFLTHWCLGQHVSDFTSLAPGVQDSDFHLPTSHTFQYLMETGDPLTEGGTLPTNCDFTGYIPISGSSTNGYLSVNSEADPGNVTIMDIAFESSLQKWEITRSQLVDFSPVLLTKANCAGTVTPWGTVISCEENTTGDGNGDGYNDTGWAIEIDPVTKTVIDQPGDLSGGDKLWAMGNFKHENAAIHANYRTVYQGVDNNPGYLFKFVADNAANLSSGILYVYQGSKNGPGNWIPIDNTTQAERNTTLDQSAAVQATIFDGIEEVEINPIDGAVYLAVKGEGRVYRFQDSDPVTGTTVSNFETYVGGMNYDINDGNNVSNIPWGLGNDNLAFDDQGNLWVLQDRNTSSNFIWLVRNGHSQQAPLVDIFARTPFGSEPTGITFSPDFKYLFMSIQHPDGGNGSTTQLDALGNSVPFDKNTVLVISRAENLGSSGGGSGTGLLATYYQGKTLDGPVLLTRVDPEINFNWGSGSPGPEVPTNRFSVRWEGLVEPEYSETYTFYTTGDDGIRLFVNGQPVTDGWVNQGPTEYGGTISLQGGQKYSIALEYYEDGGGAVAKLEWSSASQSRQVIPQNRLFEPNPGTGAGGTGLMATYFQGKTLNGPVLLTRVDPEINFNWGSGSPGSEVPTNRFSVLWEGLVEPEYSETYTFYTTGDDGIRSFVNGQSVTDGWVNQGPTEYSGNISLQAGQRYTIVMEYYEDGGGAVAQLEWSSPSQTRQVVPQNRLFEPNPGTGAGGTGLIGTYFQGKTLTGAVLLTRVDPEINFDWGSGSPGPGVPTNSFSVRWEGQVEPAYSEDYTFYSTGDDGIRLFVNGQQVTDGWVNQAPTEYSGTISLQGGMRYSLVLEYYEAGGGAVAKLEWSSASQSRQMVPQNRLFEPGATASSAILRKSSNPLSHNLTTLQETTVSVFPNPAKDYLTIQLSLEQAENFDISISDLLGRQTNLGNHYFSAGASKIAIQLSSYSLPPGLYILNISSPNSQQHLGKIYLTNR